MIRLEYCRVRKLLLVHFGEAFEPAPLGLLNDLLARFVAVEGTVDTIIDVSTAPLTRAARPVIERGLLPSHMPDRRRVFVVGDDVQRELVEIYATYQQTIGMPAPTIVRSLTEALMVLDCETVGFEPWTDDEAPP